MTGKTYKGLKANYTLDKEIGRGGEGQVFSLSSHSQMVLKLYGESLSPQKLRKLERMVSLADKQLDQYTAWPVDLVREPNGATVGFVMRRLTGYVPLHMLFSPMDRKRLFPDKGYDFLAHVARNLATAFHALHGLQLVVGDVNEGNILVNERGMIAFIDCDSFQIKDKTSVYYCEVGVPRYTPPELLSLSSFENVIRTDNTDNFSMAILLFQLLFLGRHPFAGINMTKEDIDEESAIKQRLFAYSLTGQQRKLSAPKGSFAITNLPIKVVGLFHRAFEQEKERPQPAEWINELDWVLKNMAKCRTNKSHAYPNHLPTCPWCQFKDKFNIVYFIDDTSIEQLAAFQNIESFVNGFKFEPLKLDKLQAPTSEQLILPIPSEDERFRYYKWYHRAALALVVIAGLALISMSNYAPIIAIGLAVLLNNTLPWKNKLQAELKKREGEFNESRRKLEAATNEYEFPTDARSYEKQGIELQNLVFQYKNLPAALEKERRASEARLYAEQLHAHLSNFDIRNYKIPKFGATRKLALYQAGIRTAADMSKLSKIKIQGVGPAYEQTLLSWQRQMSSTFLYQPDQLALRRSYEHAATEAKQKQIQLEQQLKAAHQSLVYQRANILGNRNQLRKHIDLLRSEYSYAHQSFANLRRVIG
jgi:DNA-binding helix-hairpin-helix protein with protein kinase domain